ncbi:MAG: hypothetical protein ACI4RA_08570 [Kiritimatiellia bacterium]
MMTSIEALTRRLGAREPEWMAAELPGGARDPLVKLGVLERSHLAAYYACPATCDADCEGRVAYFDRNRSGRGPCDYAAHCLLDGHLIEISPEKLAVLAYRPRRLAERVAAALDCEGDICSPVAGVHRLGRTKEPLGKKARDIILVDRLDSVDVLKAQGVLPNNKSFLLLVGHWNGEGADETLRRRIFRYADVLRVADEGGLEVDRARMAEALQSPRDKPEEARADRKTTENRIAEYCLKMAIRLFNARTAKERRQIQEDCLTLTAIGEAVGLDKSVISRRYLGKKHREQCLKNLKGASGVRPKLSDLQPHVLFYMICTSQMYENSYGGDDGGKGTNGEAASRQNRLFDVFREYARRQRTSLDQMNHPTVYRGLLTDIGEWLKR